MMKCQIYFDLNETYGHFGNMDVV